MLQTFFGQWNPALDVWNVKDDETPVLLLDATNRKALGESAQVVPSAKMLLYKGYDFDE